MGHTSTYTRQLNTTKGNEAVKTMTCKQLGGTCGFKLQGNSPDEIIKAQDKHLNETVAGGDETHQRALEDMKGRWEHPDAGKEWYETTQRDFASLPDD